MRVKITRPFLAKLRATGKARQRFFDTEITSFFVRVLPGGKLSYGVMYGPKGRRKQLTIGSADVLMLEQARQRAKEELSKATLGGDPQAEKAKLAEAPTFKKWKQEYLDSVVRPGKKSARNDELYLAVAEKHWGSYLLDAITADEISKVFQLVRREGVGLPTSADTEDRIKKIRAASKKRWKGQKIKTTTANRWLASVRACLKEAWRRNKVKELPAMKVKLLPENPPRARVLTDDEMKHVLEAVAGLEDPYARTAFTLLIETGARLSEVLHAKWEDIDLDGRLWRLPSPKAGKPQVIALTDSTCATLRNLVRLSPFVIPPGPRIKAKKASAKPSEDKAEDEANEKKPPRPRADLKKPWQKIKEAAKLPADVHIHDLRRTFGLHVARKAGLHVASRILRHSDVRITERVYAPLGIDELRKAMEEVNEARAKVLPMKPKKAGSAR